MNHVVLEAVIAQEVTSRIAENIGSLTPQETAELYFVAIGACLAELYDDSTATGVQILAGNWARFGFTEATATNLIVYNPS